MVRPDRHPEFPREIVKYFIRGDPIATRPHGLQNGVSHRHRGCLLATSGVFLPSRRWRSPSRASSPLPLGRDRLSTEPRQDAFGGFQLIELLAKPCPFDIEPREPLGNPLLFLPNLVQRRHLLPPPRPPNSGHNTTAPVFSDK